MKLLLTSTGLTHPEIIQAFLEFVEKLPKKIKIAFVSTAARSKEELSFVEESINELTDLGIENILSIDVNRVSPKEILICDAMYVCGGNTFYLLNEVRCSGFDKIIKQFINSNKLYVGVSAGSILVTPTIEIAQVEPADPNDVGISDLTGLNIVGFEISPHTPEIISWENIDKFMKRKTTKLYAISDKTAIKLLGDSLEIIGERKYKSF